MGTRFARIVSLRRGPRVIWLDPEQAVGAGVPAPVSSMKARISVAVAALVIVSGVAWIPAVTAENEQQLGATMQRNELGSAREGEYLATARLWTAEVYDAALKHEMSAFAGHPPEGLTVDEAVLVQFATRLSKERVTGWSQNENIVGQAVAGDPINSGHASVTVSVTERTPRGDQAVSLHFSVTEPGFDGVNGRRRWVLDAIQSDQ